jgi:hypothetical protein
MIDNPCIMNRFREAREITGADHLMAFAPNGSGRRWPFRVISKSPRPAKSGPRNSLSPFVTCQPAGTPIQTEHVRLLGAGTYGAECWLISS